MPADASKLSIPNRMPERRAGMKIAISGPAASGKGAISRALARRLSFPYIDAGLIFRAVVSAWRANASNRQEPTANEIASLLSSMIYKWSDDQAHLFFAGAEITDTLAADSIARSTAEFCSNGDNLTALCGAVDTLAERHANLICDGRNAGTLIVANADFKFFVTAAVRVRAQRRYVDLSKRGLRVSLSELERSLEERDRLDSGRSVGPLTRSHTDGWVEIDNSLETLDASVDRIYRLIASSQ